MTLGLLFVRHSPEHAGMGVLVYASVLVYAHRAHTSDTIVIHASIITRITLDLLRTDCSSLCRLCSFM